ncbi:glycoside hydrolase family 76 protein [Arthrobacter sp. LAPM80]|uniref:glycoside hydrolase family 76 protein n=1 Tax=Arthrobacter sp. LAPM80 TaxID=3141788 RepID=UPI00398B8709
MTAHPGNAGAPNPDGTWPALAEQAAAAVNTRFGHRLAGLPGTWIGSIEAGGPEPRPLQLPWSEWHYWWQAHYLDAIVDAGFLALARGRRTAAHAELRRAKELLRGIMARNFGRFPNSFYDDMAWLALAAARLNGLSLRLTARPAWLAGLAIASLTRQLHGAYDMVLGGGIYWSRKRDFKNTPANGPAALHCARTGDPGTARAIVDWLRTELFDPETGLYVDGIHPSATGRDVENTIYTYNQGPILAALLELGSRRDLDDAADLVDAVNRHLGTPGLGLRLEPGGDGSLFTGILCRYLAIAAHDERLPEHTRETASNLVAGTATVLAGQAPVLLSAAVQRWSVLSAAAG